MSNGCRVLVLVVLWCLYVRILEHSILVYRVYQWLGLAPAPYSALLLRRLCHVCCFFRLLLPDAHKLNGENYSQVSESNCQPASFSR